MASKSSKPSGLSISRSNLNFTLTWTTHDYTDQDMKIVRTNPPAGKDKTVSISDKNVKKGTKKYTHKLSFSDYCPETSKKLTDITFKVRGKQKNKSESEWAEKSYAVKIPGKCKYIAPVVNSNNPNVCTYSWDRNAKDTEHNVFRKYEYQTILIQSSTLSGSSLSSSDWDKAKSQTISILDQKSGNRKDNQPSIVETTDTALTVVEPSSTINDGLTRFVRVRPMGPAGKQTDWQYSSHKFGAPKEANVDPDGTKITDSDSQGTEVDLDIEIPGGLKSEGDEVEYQYAITTPFATETVVTEDGATWKHYELSLPPGFSSWNTWRSYRAVEKGEDKPHLTIPAPILDNQMLFARANTKHDAEITHGRAYMIGGAQNGVGRLSSPVISSVSDPDPTTLLVTLSVNSNSLAPADLKAFVAVYCRTGSDPNPTQPLAIIPYNSTSVTFKVASDEAMSFGVRAFVADYSPISASQSDVTMYQIRNIQMESSSINWDSSSVSLPKPPSNVRLSRKKEGTIQVNWDWSWTEADAAEISWSTDPDAWESNNAPQTHIVSNTNSGQFYISGLGAGTYYVRVRLIKSTADGSIYGTYSNTVDLNLSSAPNSKNLMLSDSTGPVDGEITVTWDYETTDGTSQSYAELAEAVRNQSTNQWDYTPLPNASTNTAQHIIFKPSDFGWQENTEHYIALSTSSQSGMTQEWGEPVHFAVVTKPVAVVTGIGSNSDPIHPVDIPIDDEGEEFVTVPTLTRLPLTFTVSGAGIGGTTSAALVRYDDFNLERPDGKDLLGYEGETIARETIQNAGDSVEFSWENDDGNIIGLLDDEAKYKLIVSVKDSYGQIATVEPLQDLYGVDQAYFEVHWDTQATLPLAHVSYDREHNAGFITIDEPAEHSNGGYCEIYRLSVDDPQLIVSRAEIGQTYVDPYPTLGIHGGYRVVYKTKYGDYRTNDGWLAWRDFTDSDPSDVRYFIENNHIYAEHHPADAEFYENFNFYVNSNGHLTLETNADYYQDFWLSEGDLLVQDLCIGSIDHFAIMIDFDGDTLELPGNVALSNSWKKDFQLTRYLGGSIEGDWNPGVERTGTYNADIPAELEPDKVEGLRKLAAYSGVCHIRTPEGSNFYANVDVSEAREEKWVNAKAGTTLTITQCDRIDEDGVTFEEWLRRI